jgi:hypothetical protein
MSSEEKMRSSVDAARDPAQPVLPTVNPDALKSPEPASFHPAVYIAYARPSHERCHTLTVA